MDAIFERETMRSSYDTFVGDNIKRSMYLWKSSLYMKQKETDLKKGKSETLNELAVFRQKLNWASRAQQRVMEEFRSIFRKMTCSYNRTAKDERRQ